MQSLVRISSWRIVRQLKWVGVQAQVCMDGRVAEVDCKERHLAVPSVLFMTLSTKFRLTKHEWDFPHLSKYIMMA